MNLDTVAKHFCIAAIWADCPEGTQPRATKQALADARRYAATFCAAHAALCDAVIACEDYGWDQGQRDADSAFGHDLFLTSAGHGVGFWSRDSLEIALGDGRELGEAITDALHWQPWSVETEFYRGWLYLHLRMPK